MFHSGSAETLGGAPSLPMDRPQPRQQGQVGRARPMPALLFAYPCPASLADAGPRGLLQAHFSRAQRGFHSALSVESLESILKAQNPTFHFLSLLKPWAGLTPLLAASSRPDGARGGAGGGEGLACPPPSAGEKANTQQGGAAERRTGPPA